METPIVIKSKEGVEIQFEPTLIDLCITVKSALTCDSQLTSEKSLELNDFTSKYIQLLKEYTIAIQYNSKYNIPKPLPEKCSLQNIADLKAVFQNEQEFTFISQLYERKDDYIELMRV